PRRRRCTRLGTRARLPVVARRPAGRAGAATHMDRPEQAPQALARHSDAPGQEPDGVERDLRLARDGDPQALERLLRLAEPLVMNLALRMLGRREDARDATQEV